MIKVKVDKIELKKLPLKLSTQFGGGEFGKIKR